MDMKVAGTKKGITAIQADIKIPGVPLKIVMESLQKATDAKSKIIDIMDKCINSTRVIRKDCWPVSEKLTIEIYQRPRLMGSGGLNIKKLYYETGVQITQYDENTFTLFAPSQSAMNEAKEFIENLLQTEKIPELEFGGIYTAKITEIKDIGVMVTLYESMPPALLHNSQLDQRKVSFIVYPNIVRIFFRIIILYLDSTSIGNRIRSRPRNTSKIFRKGSRLWFYEVIEESSTGSSRIDSQKLSQKFCSYKYN